MKIIIKTPIAKDYKSVFKLFDLKLFKSLKPPIISLIVERFDGCKKGDEVHLVVSGKKWVSHITDFCENDNEIYFVDVGVVIPTPLSSWKHIHRIERTGEKSCNVVDEIEFTSGYKIIDFFIYPAITAMFLLRKPIYIRELS